MHNLKVENYVLFGRLAEDFKTRRQNVRRDCPKELRQRRALRRVILPVIKEPETREYTANTPKCIRKVGFKTPGPWALFKIQKFASKEMVSQMCALTPGSAKLSGAKG
ncbi:60S ribosomal protein L31-like [Camelus ferus]|uniref:60S ribosomal protein L31-like n=1 Tax=Camelus ferus TaxID=419612 RepID=A0A8B8T1G4_CAMFR|nr:60S ribosomal protein L31-like [Camelus ferus]